ncbi:MAG TPA: sucrase ferredoxin [Propionibacteriaceae bacterium]
MTDPASPFRCTDAARNRFDSLLGTAPPARRWLLLEHPGPWRIDAVAGSGIEPVMLAQLTSTAQRTGTRILLVRRPGRTPASAQRRWILAGLDRATVDGFWSADAELEACVRALSAPAQSTTETPEPILLVCAHGVHDVCCALRGRPVAAALAARWPDQVWESSHVGGDRFAPNVVLLPDGFYYGNLDPQSALAAVEAHLAGAVSTAYLRGMARHPPAAQAAVAAAYARFGPLGPHDIRVTDYLHTPPVGDDDPSRSQVGLSVPGVTGVVRVEVLGVRRTEAQLTCRAVRETPATEYRIAGLTVSEASSESSAAD